MAELPLLTIRVHDDVIGDGLLDGQRIEVLRDGKAIGQLASVTKVTHIVEATMPGTITVELIGRGDMESHPG